MKPVFAVVALALSAGLWLQAGGIWLDVPFVKQEQNGCGAAALGMVMRYWQRQGAAVTVEAGQEAGIQRELYSPAAHGIATGAMPRFLEAHGFRTVVFGGEWDDLRRHLAQGRPLIVCLGSRAAKLHYVVAVGIDENGLAVNDPADRKLRRVDRTEFEKKWRSAGNWTLLAVPRPAS